MQPYNATLSCFCTQMLKTTNFLQQVDKYYTVQPHTLIRQHLDYGHWYDRNKWTQKDIIDTQYVSCMNQSAGNLTIDARLQRHFCVFALSIPGTEALQTIYNSILMQHMMSIGFPLSVQKQCTNIVNAALYLHLRMSQTFLASALKFHYIFSLRDLSNIFQV